MVLFTTTFISRMGVSRIESQNVTFAAYAQWGFIRCTLLKKSATRLQKRLGRFALEFPMGFLLRLGSEFANSRYASVAVNVNRSLCFRTVRLSYTRDTAPSPSTRRISDGLILYPYSGHGNVRSKVFGSIFGRRI